MVRPTPDLELRFAARVLRCAAAGRTRGARLGLAVAWSFADWGSSALERPVLIWASRDALASRGGLDISSKAAMRGFRRELGALASKGLIRNLASFDDLTAIEVVARRKDASGCAVTDASGAPVFDLVNPECRCAGAKRRGVSNCHCRVLAPLASDGSIALDPATLAAWQAGAAADPRRRHSGGVSETPPRGVSETLPRGVSETPRRGVSETPRPYIDRDRDRTGTAHAVSETPADPDLAPTPAPEPAPAALTLVHPSPDLDPSPAEGPPMQTSLIPTAATPPTPPKKPTLAQYRANVAAELLDLHESVFVAALATHGRRARRPPGPETQAGKRLRKRVALAVKDYDPGQLRAIIEARGREWSAGIELSRPYDHVWADKSLGHWAAKLDGLALESRSALFMAVESAGPSWAAPMLRDAWKRSLGEAAAEVPFGPVQLGEILAAWTRANDRGDAGLPPRGEMFWAKHYSWLRKNRTARLEQREREQVDHRDFRGRVIS